MTGFMDLFNVYIMGSVQMLFGFCFFVRFLHKKAAFHFYLLFAVCGMAVIHFVSAGRIAEFGAYVLLLMVSGIFICHADWKSAVLYTALVVEVMQLCYGIVNSLWGLLYPLTLSFDQRKAGIAFMLAGDTVSLLLSGFCYYMIYWCFFCDEAIGKQYVFIVLIPVLMLFFMGEYINSVIYGSVAVGSDIAMHTRHYQMLAIQLLGTTSLFCVLFAYKKLLQSLRLSTELSLLEQEEHFLIQYVEEAKARYEKTKSFRHDIRNHIAVIKELLRNGGPDQALNYIGDMEELAGELSFPCSTNNPVADILAGNKLGIAKSMGIDVRCSLLLPYPCGLRDIDVCIILSNALDNAIHACKSMDDSAEKYIHVSGRIQGDFLLMEIENSFQGNGMIRQGTGLANIKAVAGKYHGAVDIKAQGTVFVLHVLLVIPQHPDSISQQMD